MGIAHCNGRKERRLLVLLRGMKETKRNDRNGLVPNSTNELIYLLNRRRQHLFDDGRELGLLAGTNEAGRERRYKLHVSLGLNILLPMPLGLKNATETFQRVMETILASMRWKCTIRL